MSAIAFPPISNVGHDLFVIPCPELSDAPMNYQYGWGSKGGMSCDVQKPRQAWALEDPPWDQPKGRRDGGKAVVGRGAGRRAAQSRRIAVSI